MRPLEGIRVIDLTRVVSGPYCTMLLGDLGAEIIKVERPGEGDDTRAFAPPFQGDQAAYFHSINRNKKSITLDLKSDLGKELLWGLCGRRGVGSVTKASSSIAVALLLISSGASATECQSSPGHDGKWWSYRIVDLGDAGIRAGLAAPRTCCSGPGNRRRQS